MLTRSPTRSASAEAEIEARHDTTIITKADQSFSSVSELDTSFASEQVISQLQASQSSDKEGHPKGKRKRTAAGDKAVLEAAYLSNPKPDKTARLELAKRVSLNGKEVQIWFQNRRQNDRRKSRPLSPQEIAALRYGGMQVLSSSTYGPGPMMSVLRGYTPSPPLPYDRSSSVSPAQVDTSRLTQEDQSYSFTQSQGTSISNESSPGVRGKAAEELRPADQASAARTDGETSEAPLRVLQAHGANDTARSFDSVKGYLAPSRNPSSSFAPSLDRRDSFGLLPEANNYPSTSAPTPVLPPPIRSRNVRLSMSLDGRAGLVSASPSPPRPGQYPAEMVADLASFPPIRQPQLHHGSSAQPAVTLPPITTLTNSLVESPSSRRACNSTFPTSHRLFPGRSRDTEAWERACNPATADHPDDELTMLAEKESAGSAIAAISLLRSSSSSSRLSDIVPSQESGHGLIRLNRGKRNRVAADAPHILSHAKRAKMSRASSSVARLQTDPPFHDQELDPTPLQSSRPQVDAKRQPLREQKHNSKQNTVTKSKSSRDPHSELDTLAKDDIVKHGKAVTILSPIGNESDKENWSPSETGSASLDNSPQRGQNARRRLLSSPQRKTLAVGKIPSLSAHSRKRGALSRALTAPLMPSFSHRSKARHAAVEIFEDGIETDNGPGRSNGLVGSGLDDAEVEEFMRSEVSPNKNDCVAGLLALSQGNWR